VGLFDCVLASIGADDLVKQSGHAILTVKPKSGGAEEKYLITLRKSIILRSDCHLTIQPSYESTVSFGDPLTLRSSTAMPSRAALDTLAS
jgi:hypothetical protein